MKRRDMKRTAKKEPPKEIPKETLAEKTARLRSVRLKKELETKMASRKGPDAIVEQRIR